jgi:hypothetical protein
MSENRQKTGKKGGKKAPQSAFKPGQSGNPGGRPKKDKQVEEILKAASADAARRLVELKDSPDEKIALAAAREILDRVYGKSAVKADLNVGSEDGRSVMVGMWMGDVKDEELVK